MTIKLLKVTVQATLVSIDGDGNVDELLVEPVVVKAKDWANFSKNAFIEENLQQIIPKE